MLLFERTREGVVTRRSFWLTAGGYALVLGLAFAVPFELAFRLQLEPTSLFVRACMVLWCVVFWASAVCFWRLMRRRLRDAGYGAGWMALNFVPVLGWTVLVLLLVQPTVCRCGTGGSCPGPVPGDSRPSINQAP